MYTLAVSQQFPSHELPKYISDVAERCNQPGIVVGLAWTAFGGDILFIESSLTKGKGKLTLTGNLGDVMKESAIIALEFLKSHDKLIGISQETIDIAFKKIFGTDKF